MRVLDLSVAAPTSASNAEGIVSLPLMLDTLAITIAIITTTSSSPARSRVAGVEVCVGNVTRIECQRRVY